MSCHREFVCSQLLVGMGKAPYAQMYDFFDRNVTSHYADDVAECCAGNLVNTTSGLCAYDSDRRML